MIRFRGPRPSGRKMELPWRAARGLASRLVAAIRRSYSRLTGTAGGPGRRVTRPWWRFW
jgi:hypothetical protein